MRKFTRLISCAVAVILFTSVAAFGQIPAEQAVVEIENTKDGIIEETINGDTLTGGVRVNPNRIYMLKPGAPYIVTAQILFGGGQDTTSTLTIVGEEGGLKPSVLTTPAAGGDAFTHIVIGSLKLKNVYWPTLTTDEKATVLFRLQGTDTRLELEDFIHENQRSGDVFSLGGVKGEMDIIIKNCYFRDMTKFTNPWNYAIFTRGDHNAIDTLWMENVTVANGGLLVMNKYCVVNFAFFNHNTIQNIPRYWNFMEQWKEAYFTNNLFINCLWMGEMTETKLTQLQSQSEYGSAHEETNGVPVGIINLMRPEPSKTDWEIGFPGQDAPTIDDVKFLASNNLTFTSPFLNNYYEGGLNDSLDVPISYTNWDAATGLGWDGPPQRVSNIPAMMFGPSLDSLIGLYDGVVANDNYPQMDPDMTTKMIESQAEGDLYGTWAQANYSWQTKNGAPVDVEVPEKVASGFTIGDYNPNTIPGDGVEDSPGMTNVMDMPEDFTYNDALVSTIDGLKLGAQEWYGDISDWDSEQQLAWAKQMWAGTLGVDENTLSEKSLVSIYPNPAGNMIHLDSETALSSASFYDVTGRLVMLIELEGAFNNALDISSLNNGLYLIQVEMENGSTSASKLIKK
ncbi:MAG: T9SS type A sorting domain-containing protein [Bacteroidetes bacterium]|nr:T9SS type A sorting domain-containing protein [Bacteroidota bacterium]